MIDSFRFLITVPWLRIGETERELVFQPQLRHQAIFRNVYSHRNLPAMGKDGDSLLQADKLPDLRNSPDDFRHAIDVPFLLASFW